MVQQQGIVRGDTLQRIASIGFILGAILTVIPSLLHPGVSDPSNTQEVLQILGSQKPLVQICCMLVAAGFWAVMFGTAGIHRSITSGAGAAWARLGFYGILVATAMWTITTTVNMARADAAANWLAAPAADKDIAYSIAATLHAASLSIGTMSTIGTWLALAFLGLGMVLSVVYPRWIGCAGMVVGIATVVAGGIVPAFAEPSTTLDIIFRVLSLLTILWILAVGIWVARKAW